MEDPTREPLLAAGLPGHEVDAWVAAAPEPAPFDAAVAAGTRFWGLGEALLTRLPARPLRSEAEQAAAATLLGAADAARDRFLRAHAERVHDELTDRGARPLRAEALVYAAAERYPGLTPTRQAVAAEAERRQGDKDGAEIAQGLLLSHVLASPRAGAHLVWASLRPTEAALERREELAATGRVDLGRATVERRGRAGFIELRNPRHLNAEDDTTLAPFETAVDLVLLDPEIEVGVLRGGELEHPRYAGRRIFGAGLNLTHLYHGRISFLFFMTRDLGVVNKLYRGLSAAEHRPGAPEETTEKLFVAVAETFAIGGACQLLLVVDHTIAEHGCRLYLPARKEGIIPGAANLRLPRFVGDRAARQAIFSGREYEAGAPDADALCDEVVAPGAVDDAIAARVEALTSSGIVNAAANRRAVRVAQEPLDVFRAYMATYAREQAVCHFSPALVANLERHWNAHERRL
jgi:(3,5-dihydroxyphenyl)acetyl-CoA 1,2-dioxygenase